MDTTPAAEPVARALALAHAADPSDPDPDQDAYRSLLRQAAADGPGSLTLGRELIRSPDPVDREAGCALLGHAGDRHEELRAEAATALIGLARRESGSGVLAALARALGGTADRRAVPVLVTLAGHPDAGVREQVAAAFPGVATGLPDGPDTAALITLTRDPDPQVRNWATFSLGLQLETDSPAIRAALWERTRDEDPDAREEGIHGLARRHDPRAVPLLLELLGHPDGAHTLTFHAAAVLGAPELLPALQTYDADGTGVDDAVNACDPVRRARLDAAAWDLLCTLDRLRPDLRAALRAPRFDPGLELTLGSAPETPTYDLEALLRRAADDPTRAADLVAADHPPDPDQRSSSAS
ncbi:HEAT repeat domain-containing protein [Kitasatospora sp. NPDC048540]|uniref:HEAT repeat domain-containing protein n=1 Tax=Kitasatospora sp. NPDC048540 TaxID=3155634 RepID=UPI0033F30D8D